MEKQKITINLWYDKEAEEAALFYISIFDNSKIIDKTLLHNTPSGDCDIISFKLSGESFIAISAGPLFKFNPSISFHVKCKTKEEVDRVWNRLSAQGKILMELGEYPWSERYGWCNDKYGLSWQIMYVGEKEFTQRITPVLMFAGNVYGKAIEAVNFYTEIFPNGKINTITYYDKDEEKNKKGTVKYADFTLLEKEFGIMDSAGEHKFTFNEAISFIINCKDQKEIDYYWEKLSAVPESEQCGWIKDKYGLSWQIVPQGMDKVFKGNDEKKIARITEAFLNMKKIDIAELEKVSMIHL